MGDKMGKRTSYFLQYLEDEFYDKISNSVLYYVRKNRQIIENKIGDSKRITGIDIDNVDFRTAYINDKGSTIEFDIAVIADFDIQFRYGSHYDFDSESVTGLWFIVSCKGKITDEGIKNFFILGTDEFNKTKLDKPLTHDLVPIITKEEYSKYAKEILSKFYPEALRRPTEIDVNKLASNMGLNIIETSLSKDNSIFGKIIFKECEIELYDPSIKKEFKKVIKENTILMDTTTTYMLSFGSKNMTIAHECVHFFLHRKAFLFAQLMNKEIKSIQCEARGVISNNSSHDSISWMEIQANGIAPYILVPDSMLKIRLDELLKQYSLEDNSNILDSVPLIIDDVARTFGVTKYAARKRLIDIGFHMANGTYVYVDGHYTRPYCYNPESIGPNQSYTVTLKEAMMNIGLCNISNKYNGISNFIFVENHLCINNEKYITHKKNGNLILTEYARHHIDECCIAFDIKPKTDNDKDQVDFYNFCYLCKDVPLGKLSFQAAINSDKNQALLNKADILKAQHETIKRQSIIQTMNYGDAITFLMKDVDVNEEELADRTGYSTKTIQNYRNNKIGNPSKDVMVAICAGLKLHPDIARMLLSTANCDLKSHSNKRDFALSAVIGGMLEYTIEEINKCLVEFGTEPLNNIM